MKLLRIVADGLPLFREKLDICFYAQQRVSVEQQELLYPVFSNIYLNPANGIIGINASGKTSVLKVILLALGIDFESHLHPTPHFFSPFLKSGKEAAQV